MPTDYTNYSYTFGYPGSGYQLGDRVQFVYNGALCQGNVFQVLSTGNYLPLLNKNDILLIINVDVCDRWSLLPETYNNIQISIYDVSLQLKKVFTQDWY